MNELNICTEDMMMLYSIHDLYLYMLPVATGWQDGASTRSPGKNVCL